MRLQVAGARSRRGRHRARAPAALGLSLATFATLGAPTGIEGSRDTASKSHTFSHHAPASDLETPASGAAHRFGTHNVRCTNAGVAEGAIRVRPHRDVKTADGAVPRALTLRSSCVRCVSGLASPSPPRVAFSLS